MFRQFVHLDDNPPEEICYLLHLDPPYKHAAHYLGSSEDFPQRNGQHDSSRGANLLRVQKEAGGTWHLVRTWAGGKAKERQLKTRSGTQYCPECTDRPLPGDAPPRADAKYLTRKQRAERQAHREAPQYEPVRNARDLTYGQVQEVLRGRPRETFPEISDTEQLAHIERLEAHWRRAMEAVPKARELELEAG